MSIMADRTFKVYFPNVQLIDPLGSIIINTNTTINPNYQWVVVNKINSVGIPDPTKPVLFDLGLKDTVSYKIKFLDSIKRYQDSVKFIGSSACLTAPDNVACGGYGPYIINSKKYYIDFFVLYFVNTSVVPQNENPADYIISGPTLSVDTSRCSAEYGIFIAAPKSNTALPTYLTATSSASINDGAMFYPQLPEYTNDLGFFNPNISYRFTTVDSSSNFTENTLTPGNIVQTVLNTITYGQTSITCVNNANSPIALYPQSTTNPSSFAPQSYYPFLIFRYVSEDATTKQIFLNFTFAANV
ncbi:MAG: hypothetical protein QXP88_00730 [Thermoproteota archaeon]